MNTTVHRALSLVYYRTAYSPKGARLNGGRFNRPGVAAVYASLDQATALAEYHRGQPRPAVVVSASLEAVNLVELEADLSSWSADWQDWNCDWEAARDHLKAGLAVDCSSWRCGDAAVTGNCCGIIFPSTQNPGGRNVVLFPEDAPTGSLVLSPHDPLGEILAAHPPTLP